MISRITDTSNCWKKFKTILPEMLRYCRLSRPIEEAILLCTNSVPKVCVPLLWFQIHQLDTWNKLEKKRNVYSENVSIKSYTKRLFHNNFHRVFIIIDEKNKLLIINIFADMTFIYEFWSKSNGNFQIARTLSCLSNWFVCIASTASQFTDSFDAQFLLGSE